MTWHGHRNGGEPVIWLDGLDNPLLFLLQATTWEAFPGGLQPLKNAADCVAPRVGTARPVWEKSSERPTYNLHYKWQDTYETLQRLSDGKSLRWRSAGIRQSGGRPYDAHAILWHSNAPARRD